MVLDFKLQTLKTSKISVFVGEGTRKKKLFKKKEKDEGGLRAKKKKKKKKKKKSLLRCPLNIYLHPAVT